MKKILKRMGVFFLVSMCVFGLYSCGETENAEQENAEQEVESETMEQAVNEAKEETGNYYYIGDTIQFSNGVTYTIVDGGTYLEYETVYVYLEMDVQNGSDSEWYISATDAVFYADDYVLEPGFPSQPDNKNFLGASISPGRKGNGRFYAECPEYDMATQVEAEIGNAIIVLKDSSNIGSETESN